MLTSEELREIRKTRYGVCTVDETMAIRPCPVKHLLSHIDEQAKEFSNAAGLVQSAAERTWKLDAENATLRQKLAAVQGVINALLTSIKAHCGDPEADGGYRYLCSTCAANWDAIQELRLALGGKENE